MPVPDEIVTSAPRVTGAFISISPFAVVMLLEIVRAEELTTNESKPVDPPTVPKVIVPAPLVIVRLSVLDPPPSALIAFVPKSTFPSLPVPETSLVRTTAPSIVTAPSKSISPT